MLCPLLLLPRITLHRASAVQVLQDYARYADAQLGRWSVKEDGHKDPGVRLLMRPVLNLFHGEKGSKRCVSSLNGLPQTICSRLRTNLLVYQLWECMHPTFPADRLYCLPLCSLL